MGGGGGGSSEPYELSLNPPLHAGYSAICSKRMDITMQLCHETPTVAVHALSSGLISVAVCMLSSGIISGAVKCQWQSNGLISVAVHAVQWSNISGSACCPVV